MGAPLRSRLQMDERRSQLLDRGLELFSRRSYEEVAIEDIARAADVSKGLLYHYFGGKRQLYLEVVREAARSLLAATEPDPSLPPMERGLSGLHAYLAFAEDCAPQFETLVTGGLGGDPDVAAIVEHTRMAFIGRLMLELGLHEPRPIFRTALRSWVGSVEAASLDWLRHRDVDRTTLVRLLLTGLRGVLLGAVQLDPLAGVDVDDLADPTARGAR